MWLVTLVLIFSFLLQREVEKCSKAGGDQEGFSVLDKRDGDMFAGPLESSNRQGGMEELLKYAAVTDVVLPSGRKGWVCMLQPLHDVASGLLSWIKAKRDALSL